MTISSASTSTPNRIGKATFGQIIKAGGLAILLAIVVNLILRAVMFALVPLPAEFPPLTPGAIAFFTTLGVGAATLVFALINRLSTNPARTFTIVAVAALILSILPNFGMAANPASFPFPGATPAAAYTLIVFHVAAALVSVVVLTRTAKT